VQHGWHGTHRCDIHILATHASTWVHRYSSLLQWPVPLGQRGHVAMVRRIFCTKCTLHSNHRLTVWYSNTQNDFFPEAAIFSLHTLASPSGRNVNYDGKETTYWGKNIFFLSCSFYLYRFGKYVSYGFPTINCCNPGVNYETPCILAEAGSWFSVLNKLSRLDYIVPLIALEIRLWWTSFRRYHKVALASNHLHEVRCSECFSLNTPIPPLS